MLKKMTDLFILLLTSGLLFHRCTILGAFCGFWVYVGTAPDESAFIRMLTPDLYIFMAAFLLFYRLMFKKSMTDEGDLDLKATGIYFLGDMVWAVAVMFCAVPFLMMTNYSGAEMTQQRAAANARALMRQIPKH